MTFSQEYFTLARNEELSGQPVSALLHYLSAFCAGFHPGMAQLPYQATAKIRKLQISLRMTDEELLSCVRSYGSLTDNECRRLLYYSIYGQLSEIRSILSGAAFEGGDLCSN